MILYVDETENEEFFIVTGLLMPSKEDTDLAYKQFKKKITDYPLSEKERKSIYNEFKSVILDKHYQRIKVRMLEAINSFDDLIIYSCYMKKSSKAFQQETKEDTYITLLANIINELPTKVKVVFDKFNKVNFENRIIDTFRKFATVETITANDSILEPGLQFVDNICSVIRLNKTKADKYKFYEIIEKNVKEV